MGLRVPSRRRRETHLLTGVLSLDVAAMALLAQAPALWYGFVGTVLAAAVLLVALWRRDALTVSQVLGLAIAFRVAFLPLLPVLSDDAYRYVWDGMLQVNGINPYLYRPEDPQLAAFQQEAIYEQLNSASYFSVYPPLSQLIFAVGGFFYEWGWTVSYYVIKGVFVAFEVGGMVLLSKMTAARNLMLYAWNPVALVEAAGQAHTEAAVVVCVVASVWAVRRGAWVTASLALTAAVWVKLYPVVLLPLLWRRFGWRPLAPVAFFSIVLCLPYASAEVLFHFASSLNLYVQLFEFNAGLYYGIKELLWWFTGADWSKTLGPALGAVYAVSLLGVYWRHATRGGSFLTSAVLVLTLFFLFSTTIHPWYLLTLLPLVVAFQPPLWGWLWIGITSLCTYLFYIDGPYWSTVAIGWVGGGALFLRMRGAALLQTVLRWRAERKVKRVRPHFKSLIGDVSGEGRVLDLGAGEGYVGEQLRREEGTDVQLVDVIDMNRTALPHRTYNGRELPYADEAFDVTLLYFTLHHCADPRQVLREARRVSKQGVIVVESTYSTSWQHRLLYAVDVWANRWRSGGQMTGQEDQLCFQRPSEWRTLIQELGGRVQAEQRFGSPIHEQVLFIIK